PRPRRAWRGGHRRTPGWPLPPREAPRPTRRATGPSVARRSRRGRPASPGGSSADVAPAVDRVADVVVQGHVERDLLRREDYRHVVERIDPEQHRGIAVPEELADRAAVLLRRPRRAGADEDIEPESARALGRQPQAVAVRNPRVEVV